MPVIFSWGLVPDDEARTEMAAFGFYCLNQAAIALGKSIPGIPTITLDKYFHGC